MIVFSIAFSLISNLIFRKNEEKNSRNYFIVIDQSQEMWTAVKFAIKKELKKTTKSKLTTISFIDNVSDGMMLTSSTESILNKDQLENEKIKHKEVHDFI